MVAAYLIGARGTARHAVALGATVTVTHTIGVFALGLVTLALSQYLLPEDLYPWLNLVSGLLVVAVGAGVLRSRLRSRSSSRITITTTTVTTTTRPRSCAFARPLALARTRSPSPSPRARPHHVEGAARDGRGRRADSCPSALVVLLGAIAQHQVGLGLVMIVAFSLGLAATLTVLGLMVVYARRAVSGLRVPPRLVAVLPSASALVIVGVGVVLTAQAVPQF